MMMSPMMHPPPSHAVGGSHRYAAEAYMQLLSRALSMGGGDALAAQVWRCVGMGSLGSSSTMCVCVPGSPVPTALTPLPTFTLPTFTPQLQHEMDDCDKMASGPGAVQVCVGVLGPPSSSISASLPPHSPPLSPPHTLPTPHTHLPIRSPRMRTATPGCPSSAPQPRAMRWTTRLGPCSCEGGGQQGDLSEGGGTEGRDRDQQRLCS